MTKEFIINNKIYTLYIEPDFPNKVLFIKAIYGTNFMRDEKIYEKTIRENIILELIGLTVEKRTEYYVRKAMKKIKKHAYKESKVEKAYKNNKDILSLDEYMDV